MLDHEGHVVTVATVLEESGYTEMWQQDKSPEAPGRLENLKELVRALADFETLAGFLDHVSLVMENEEAAAGDRVSLMTLHGAKGLEFDTVFLPGWEEGLFPNQRALDEGGAEVAGGGAAAGVCRPHAGAATGDRVACGEPAHLCELAEPASPAVLSTNCRTPRSNGPVLRRWLVIRACWRQRRSADSFRWWLDGRGPSRRGSNRRVRRGAMPFRWARGCSIRSSAMGR